MIANEVDVVSRAATQRPLPGIPDATAGGQLWVGCWRSHFRSRRPEAALPQGEQLRRRPPVAEPGALWNCNGGHTLLLAEVLEQRSGRSLLDLARTDLFEPLGIAHWQWRSGLHRRPLAYAGLRLLPSNLLRLGQLLLAGGGWQRRQVVPAAWVAASMQPSITIDKGPFRYGRHWWDGLVQHDGRNLAWTAGVGNGGQRLFIVPELDLAVVFTAGAYGPEQIGWTEFALFRQIVAAA